MALFEPIFEALEAVMDQGAAMTAETGREAGDWKATWEDHRRRNFTRGLAATPAQRLAWLEEMISFAHRTGALPRKTPPSERSVD